MWQTVRYVARPEFNGLFQEIIDRAHDGRAAGKIPQAFDVVLAQLLDKAWPRASALPPTRRWSSYGVSVVPSAIWLANIA